MSYCNWNIMKNNNSCFNVVDKKNGIVVKINDNCINYYRNLSRMLNRILYELKYLVFVVNEERLVEVMNEYQREQSISYKESISIICSLIPQINNKNMINEKPYRELFKFLLDFEGSKKNIQMNDLFLFVLTLCNGKIFEKLKCLFHCLGGRLQSVDDYIISNSKLEYLLNFYLCLFLSHSDNSELSIEKIKEISYESCYTAIKHIILFNNNNNNKKNMKNISLKMFAKWFELYGDTLVPWIRFIDLNEVCHNSNNNNEITPNVSEISGNSLEYSRTFQNHDDDDDDDDDDDGHPEESDNDMNSENNSINSESSQPDELIFDFPLSGNNNHLCITSNNINFLNDLVEECKLYYFTCNDLYECLLNYTYNNNQHFILRSKYYEFLKDIIPGKYHEFFIDLYNSFDLTSTNSVNIKQLYLCLSILVYGSKSEKLFYNFNLISSKNIANNNNSETTIPYFTIKDMIYCLRSYLTLLMCINKRSNRHEISNIIYNTCIEISYQLFNDSGNNNDNIIIFEDFAKWYNESGYLLTPWIELLDIKKWKVFVSNKPDKRGNNESITIENNDDNNNNKKVKKINPILLSIGQNYNILFSKEVVDLYYHIRESFYENTNGEMSENILLEILKLNNNQVYVDFDTYIEILDLLIGEEQEDDDDDDDYDNEDVNQKLKFYFTQIYKMFYKNLDNNIIEIITMFLFFLDGTKSDKLNLLFLYFDQTCNYELNMKQLYSFLYSLLLTIINLTPDKDITLFQIHDVVSNIIATHFKNDEYISLEKFANWYNESGYEFMSWIELISPNKWPNNDNNESTNHIEENNNYNQQQQQQYTEQDAIYEFELYPNKRLLIIDANSNEKLNELISAFQFNKYTVSSFFNEIKQFLPSNLNEEIDYNNFLSNISKKLFKRDMERFNHFKSYFIYIYELLQQPMSYAELLTCLSIFTKNNKTTKLCECWLYFIDKENIPSPSSTSSSDSINNNYYFITKENFKKYLRMFLLSLFYMCNISKNSNELKIIEKHIDFVYENMIEYYSSYNNKQSDYSIEEYINFMDFANYYNTNGSKYISWLELLDLSKWPIKPIEQQQQSNRYNNDYVNQIDEENDEDNDENDDDDDDDVIYQNIEDNNSSEKNYQINSFNLELCDKNYLSVTADNTLRLLEFLKSSGFITMNCNDISDSLNKAISNNNNNNNNNNENTILRDDYNMIIEQFLLSFSNNNNNNNNWLSNVMNTVYTIFEFLLPCDDDDNNNNMRYIKDILIVYNLFGIGSKSEKLEYSFSLYSSDGVISLSELRSMFYDYLISISLFNRIYQYKNNKYNDIYEIEKIKNIVNENITKVMKSISEFKINNNNNNISFDDFANWYSESGYYIAPWIELLDIKKWPNIDIDTNISSTHPNKNNVFTFANGNNNILSLLPIDIIHHKYLVENVKLSEITSEEMINKFHEIIEDNNNNIEVSEEKYSEIINELVIKEENKEIITNIFNKIYSNIPNNYHHIKTIIGILSCYCNDKKSEKLFNIVNIFNKNPSEHDTMMNQEDINNLLTNIYYSICICKNINNNYEYNNNDNNYDFINNSMKEVVDLIFSDLDNNNNNNNTISFDVFAEWYSNGGYTALPWIELLDLNKWPKIIEDVKKEEGEENEEEEGEENDDDDDDDEKVYTFDLIEDNKKIIINKMSSKKIKDILELTKLDLMSVTDIYKNLKETMNSELVEENEKEVDFEDSILSFLPNNNIYSNEEKLKIKNELKDIYNNVKYILSKEEKEKDGNDNLKYYLCALLLYLKGNKSDKLSMIYNILQSKEKELDKVDNGLSRKEYSILLFCILRRIFEMNDENEEKKDEVCVKESESVSKKLFEYFKRDSSDDDKISFVEFAEWYYKDGENVLKWIELLDLSKWP